MSKFMIAFLVSLGASTWLYARLQRNTGNNTKQSLMASAIVGIVLLLVVFMVLGMIGL